MDVGGPVDGILHVHDRANRGSLNGLLVRGELVEDGGSFCFKFSSLVN